MAEAGEHKTHKHTQLHKVIALYQVSFGYFYHPVTRLNDLTISFQGASYISWYTSPKLTTTEVKDPSGTLLR
jgi:hypothetical protein